MRYLKNTYNGEIYEWHPILAANAKCVEITEEQAYPERFVRPEQAERVSNLALETEIAPEPDMTPPELAADAARNFGARSGIARGGLAIPRNR